MLKTRVKKGYYSFFFTLPHKAEQSILDHHDTKVPPAECGMRLAQAGQAANPLMQNMI